MLDVELVSQLTGSSIKTKQSGKRLLLMGSNYRRLCLYSFDTAPLVVQPVMLHTPFFPNLPKEADRSFAFVERSYFIRGMQLVPFAVANRDDDHFSIFLLTNSGDVFCQDFWHEAPERENCPQDSVELDDFIYENDVGGKVYFAAEFDTVTKVYGTVLAICFIDCPSLYHSNT